MVHTSARFLFLVPLFAASCGAAHACDVTAGPKGNYAVLVSGASTQGGFGKYLVGMLNVDGACNVKGSLSGGENGVFASAIVTGTYASHGSSGPNAIDISFVPPGGTNPDTYTVGYSGGANELYGVETDTTSIGVIHLIPQQTTTRTYTAASLVGTFNFSCWGNQQEFSDLNQVTFTGRGWFSGIDVYNNVAAAGSNPPNQVDTVPMGGSYTVNPNGTFIGKLNGNFDGYDITGVLDYNSQGAIYIYYKPDLGAFDACIGRK